MRVTVLSDREFIGDKGGEVGAGVSASSSSSSPHSSSLRGVMLLPSQTEWMETCGDISQIQHTLASYIIMLKRLTSKCFLLIPAPVCNPCCPAPSQCWSEAAASHGWSVCLKRQTRFEKYSDFYTAGQGRSKRRVTCGGCWERGHGVPGVIQVVCTDVVPLWH